MIDVKPSTPKLHKMGHGATSCVDVNNHSRIIIARRVFSLSIRVGQCVAFQTPVALTRPGLLQQGAFRYSLMWRTGVEDRELLWLTRTAMKKQPTGYFYSDTCRRRGSIYPTWQFNSTLTFRTFLSNMVVLEFYPLRDFVVARPDLVPSGFRRRRHGAVARYACERVRTCRLQP
ncbi:hypothetical protein EVAR_16710_1 [Eumeta japonica]|uniref:Uncharacterized protein n=1 Tax=Eumeta variegata TaxID=151549 RepID=A0A4C1V4C9_EUMVA|nr:hypothetical protein EVAR_16710_1 [Eumeta japonica]